MLLFPGYRWSELYIISNGVDITDLYSYALFSVYLGFFHTLASILLRTAIPPSSHSQLLTGILEVDISCIKLELFLCKALHSPVLNFNCHYYYLLSHLVHSILIWMTILNNLVSSANFVMAFSQTANECAGKQKNVEFPCGLFLAMKTSHLLLPFSFLLNNYLSTEKLFLFFMIVYFPLESTVRAFLGAMKISINKTFFSICFKKIQQSVSLDFPFRGCVDFSFPVCAPVHLFLDNASTSFPGRFIKLKFYRCQILKSFWYVATSQ